MADEPVILDLYFRVRRMTPGEQPVGIEPALAMHRILIGEPVDAAGFLEDIEAMDSEFLKARDGEIQRRQAEQTRKAKAKDA